MQAAFKSQYEEFIYTRTYSRYLPDKRRRETFEETVKRYYDFFEHRVPVGMKPVFEEAMKEVRVLGIVPSMRCLWSAGPALDRENIAGYNCAFAAVDNPRIFSEVLYVLMNGTGMGFSVERQHISKLPEIPSDFVDASSFKDGSSCHVVFADSKKGWAEGYRKFINHLYAGTVPTYDLSKIRPKGAILKTFGGRASGPEPLKDLLEFTANIFKTAAGRKLNSLEAHDICCKIANCVVVGGVRRSAGISLSNLSDLRMRQAKSGEFWHRNPQRSLANNSAVYAEKPEISIFMDEWISLMKSGNGERGIVNREAMQKQAAELGRDPDAEYGTNPCGEVVLLPMEFCNLTEIIVRADDSLETLKRKARLCTVLGLMQSTLTNFDFLRDTWKKNCEDERLLGVSLTGTCDHPVLAHTTKEAAEWLRDLKKATYETADEYSKVLGINRPKAITVVKPSGTVSQLVNSSSGLHPRYSRFYVRRVRVTAADPMATFLKEKGVPCSTEVGETWDRHNTLVFEFPVSAPESSVLRDDRSAVEQLEYWKMYKENYCDGNPSVTIYTKDAEWLEVGAWVYKNWSAVGGLSFLPHDGGSYPLAPYTEIGEEEYNKLASTMPALDFLELALYEKSDETFGSAEMACSGGSCELR